MSHRKVAKGGVNTAGYTGRITNAEPKAMAGVTMAVGRSQRQAGDEGGCMRRCWHCQPEPVRWLEGVVRVVRVVSWQAVRGEEMKLDTVIRRRREDATCPAS